MDFAATLKALREKAGLTQAALATASGMSLGVVRDYEQGNKEPGFRSLFRMCRALGVDCNAFADCVEESEAEPTKTKRTGVEKTKTNTTKKRKRE